jgi:selenocysteine lyase/cysteine desulfurase
MAGDSLAVERQQVDFEAVRALFPGAAGTVYMNVAARGLLSRPARAAMDEHLDRLAAGSADKPEMFATIERVREKFARLINADSDEIAYTKNVSDGLNAIASALPWQAGDNMVLCRDLEHPNNIYPWLNQHARNDVTVRSVAENAGHIDVDAIIAAIDDRTRLVTASTVTFAPGFRADIGRLGRACRARDVFLLVDGVQSVGVVDTDMRELQVDGMAVSTQKCLLGLYGLGFLYCRREWADRMTPASLARFSIDLGEDVHEATMGDEGYALMPGARRFDVGNYNYPAAVAVEPSLDLFLDIGPARIEQYVCGLAQRFAGGLHQLGLPVSGGPPGPHLAHTVTVGSFAANQNDAIDDAALESLYAHLTDNGVVLSIRRGMLRFALHLYNNEADVDRVLDLTRSWLADR